jgi:hypothetical protein
VLGAEKREYRKVQRIELCRGEGKGGEGRGARGEEGEGGTERECEVFGIGGEGREDRGREGKIKRDGR